MMMNTRKKSNAIMPLTWLQTALNKSIIHLNTFKFEKLNGRICFDIASLHRLRLPKNVQSSVRTRLSAMDGVTLLLRRGEQCATNHSKCLTMSNKFRKHVGDKLKKNNLATNKQIPRQQIHIHVVNKYRQQ